MNLNTNKSKYSEQEFNFSKKNSDNSHLDIEVEGDQQDGTSFIGKIFRLAFLGSGKVQQH